MKSIEKIKSMLNDYRNNKPLTETFKTTLQRLIYSAQSELIEKRKETLSKMYPNQYSESIERQALSNQQRNEVNNFLNKARTQSQILYYFDFYLSTNQIDAVFHFYEILKRTNNVSDLINEIETRIKDLKTTLGIDETEIKDAELTIREAHQLIQKINKGLIQINSASINESIILNY